jgi:hypothetical protein
MPQYLLANYLPNNHDPPTECEAIQLALNLRSPVSHK